MRILLQPWVFETTYNLSILVIPNPKSIHNGGLVFYYVIGATCLTIFLTVMLFFSLLHYGVLLLFDPNSPKCSRLVLWCLSGGSTPQEPGVTLAEELRSLAGGTLVIALMVAIVNIWHFSYICLTY